MVGERPSPSECLLMDVFNFLFFFRLVSSERLDCRDELKSQIWMRSTGDPVKALSNERSASWTRLLLGCAQVHQVSPCASSVSMFSRLHGSRWPRTSPIHAACQIITAHFTRVSFHSDYKSVVVLRRPMHFCPTAHGEQMMMSVGSGCVWPLESGASRCHEVIAILQR